MEITVAELQGQLAALKAENEKLREQELKAVAKVRDEAVAQAAELQKKLEDAGKAVGSAVEGQKALRAELDAAAAKLAEAEKSLAETRDELKGIYASQRQAERVAKVKAALKVDGADAGQVQAAEAIAQTFESLSDEMFAKYLQGQAKFTPAPLPPKATPAPTPPAATPAKDPKDASVEADKSGEVVTTVAKLDDVKPAPAPALQTTVAASVQAQNLARDVSAFFGTKAE